MGPLADSQTPPFLQRASPTTVTLATVGLYQHLPQGLSPHSKTRKDSQDLWLPWCVYSTSAVPNHLWPQDSSPISRDTFSLHVPILKASAWESNIPPNDLKKKKKLWQHCTACRVLVPWPGIEPKLPAVKAHSLTHWTAGESSNDFLIPPHPHPKAPAHMPSPSHLCLHSLPFLWISLLTSSMCPSPPHLIKPFLGPLTLSSHSSPLLQFQSSCKRSLHRLPPPLILGWLAGPQFWLMVAGIP